MGPYSTRAHVGSRIVSQRRYASSRHSSIHCGSFFLAEIKRTVSSDRPFGAFSDSISVTNPYLYWSTSMRRTRSIVSCTAGTLPSAHGVKARGLDCRLWWFGFPGGAPFALGGDFLLVSCPI